MIKPEYDLRPVKNPTLKKIYRTIYFANTKAGKIFDITLLVLIIISTGLVMLETVPSLDIKYHKAFFIIEFLITILFTIEYFLRIFSIKDKREYILSPFGIIDFLSIIPFYLSLFFPVLHYFVIIRMLRMLRIFRIFNLADYMHDGRYIVSALKNSSRKIYIFLLFIAVFIILMGSIMYVVEEGKNGFESIPQSIYWATVTITTVGYGDVSPSTPLGKFLSIIIMLAGYSIIAVPTGIMTSEFRHSMNKRHCSQCDANNEEDANFCKNCGKKF
ncbi:ion transporter [Amniculibacterium sp. G2-70]|uniref:ion transporter n=1 Tax=Amniculibacterium sp. G2-70 TaxID=2767188 RepID=UPI00165409D3|nr:ion transporter [Amniculibacterium sp. G2-70]